MVELNLERKSVPTSPGSTPALAAINHKNLRLSPIGPSAPGPIAVRAKKGEAGGIPHWETTRWLSLKLPTDTEPLDNVLITRLITHLDIVKQFAALADQLEQTAA